MQDHQSFYDRKERQDKINDENLDQVRLLCWKYLNHTHHRFDKLYLNDLQIAKARIIQRLRYAKYPLEINHILDETWKDEFFSCQKSNILSLYGSNPGALTNRQFLKLDSYPYWLKILRLALVILFFPIAFPIYLIWSRVTIGSWDVRKSESEVLLDQIETIASQFRFEMMTEAEREEQNQSFVRLLSSRIDVGFGSVPPPKVIKDSQRSTNEVPTTDHADPASAFQPIISVLETVNQPSFWNALSANQIAEDVGLPLIVSCRAINNNASEQVHIDVAWTFNYMNTVPCVTRFSLDKPVFLYTETVRETGQQKSNSILSWFKPNILALTHDISMMQGMGYEKKDSYLKAYNLAETDTHKTLVIEHWINALYEFHDYRIRDLCDRTSLERMKEDTARFEKEHKQDIERLKGWLPNDVERHSITARKISREFSTIFSLIEKNQFDVAWQQYVELEKLSPFIKCVFSKLVAYNEILSIIFIMSGHKTAHNEHVDIPEVDVFVTIKSGFQRIIDIPNATVINQLQLQMKNNLAVLSNLEQESQAMLAVMKPKDIDQNVRTFRQKRVEWLKEKYQDYTDRDPDFDWSIADLSGTTEFNVVKN